MNNKHYYNFNYTTSFLVAYDELGNNLPDIEDVCDEVVDRLTEEPTADISHIINEVAESNIEIYTAPLLEICSSTDFQSFVDASIAEYGLPQNTDGFMEQVCQQAQEYYYRQVIYKNMDYIVTNALIKSLQSEMLMIECSESSYYELEDKLYEFTEKYIKNVEYGNLDRFDKLLDNFYDNLLDKINEEKEISKFKKLSDNADDDDFTMLGLIIEPNKTPRPIKISKQNELKELQDCVDGIIDIHTIQNPYNHNTYCIVLNDEGKCIGLPYNFPLYNRFQGIEPDGVYDAVVGTALLFKDNGSELGSLDENEIEFWKRELRPELNRDDGINLGASLLDCGEPSQWDLSKLEKEDKTHTDYQHQTRNDDDLEL